jgi:hypothetical protein
MKLFDKSRDWQLLYNRIANNDPALTHLSVYIFTAKEMQVLHDAMRVNTHLIDLDIRVSDNAKELNAMLKIQVQILATIRNNLFRELGVLRRENAELKHATPIPVEHNCNR